MRKMIKFVSVFIAVAAGSACLASAAATAPAKDPAPTNAPAPAKSTLKPSDLFPDVVIAKGKGIEVKRSQLDDEVVRVTAQAAVSGRPIAPDQKPMLEQRILDQIINLQLLQAKATEADRATGYTQAENQFADLKSQLVTDDALNRQLKAWGATREEVLAKWREGFVAEAVLNHELKANVTDAEVKKFYDDQPSRFEQPELIRASHILLATNPVLTHVELSADEKAAKLKLAGELVKRARAGEDFAKLAKAYSDDPGSKEKGGEYTFMRGQMVPEFETAALALTPNGVSDIVTTSYGYHIIKLGDKYPAKVAGFDDEVILNPNVKYLIVKKTWTGTTDPKWETMKVSTLIRHNLEAQQRNQAAPEFLAKLKKDAGVEILDPNLKMKDELAVPRLPASNSTAPVSPTTKK
jgi:peptidyl-prolyl cis-trans isomerase C